MADVERHVCVLDVRLIHGLRDLLLSNPRYTQHLSSRVEGITRNADGSLSAVTLDGKTIQGDYAVVATQPTQAIPILQQVAPRRLIDELNKWPVMDCYTLLHDDFSGMGRGDWLFRTLEHASSGKPYSINTYLTNDAAMLTTYVYGRDCYEDFVSHHIDSSKIVKTYEPKLPVFTVQNSVCRNDLWREIDLQCTDVFWTQACRSGLQFHNDGILNAKRVVRKVLGLDW